MLRFLLLTSLAAIGKNTTLHAVLLNYSLLISLCLIHFAISYQLATLFVAQLFSGTDFEFTHTRAHAFLAHFLLWCWFKANNTGKHVEIMALF